MTPLHSLTTLFALTSYLTSTLANPDDSPAVLEDRNANPSGCIPIHFNTPAHIFHRADGAWSSACNQGTGPFSCCIRGVGSIFFASSLAGTNEGAATKFECSLPGDRSGFCNWSVIDGVSAPGSCDFPSSKSGHTHIGGGDFRKGGKCPTKLTPSGNCRNKGGHSRADRFFSNEVTGGVNWYQDSISDVMADWGKEGPGASPVQCRVGDMVFGGQHEKREDGGDNATEVLEGEEPQPRFMPRGRLHGHGHGRRRHTHDHARFTS